MVEDVAVVDASAGVVGERDDQADPAASGDEYDVLAYAGERCAGWTVPDLVDSDHKGH